MGYNIYIDVGPREGHFNIVVRNLSSDRSGGEQCLKEPKQRRLACTVLTQQDVPVVVELKRRGPDVAALTDHELP